MESKHKGDWQDLRAEETAKKEDNEKKLLPGQTTLKTISVKSAKVDPVGPLQQKFDWLLLDPL